MQRFQTLLSISTAVRSYALGPGDSLPKLEVVPITKVAKLLHSREGSHLFFAELSGMAGAVGRLLGHRSDNVRRVGELLLNPVGTVRRSNKPCNTALATL